MDQALCALNRNATIDMILPTGDNLIVLSVLDNVLLKIL